jgi:uncharacterized protein YjbJ (UPF0337 family)
MVVETAPPNSLTNLSSHHFIAPQPASVALTSRSVFAGRADFRVRLSSSPIGTVYARRLSRNTSRGQWYCGPNIKEKAMLTREELQGTWTQIKGQIRERWGQITDDELQQVHGDGEQLLGFLQKKTGQSRQELEKFVRQSMDKGQQALERGQSYVQQAADTTRDYAQRASQSVREGYEAVEHSVEEGFEEAQQMVRARPMESITAAFGAGLVAGVLVSLMLRSNRA